MTRTEQELFWEGAFGKEYTARNRAEALVPSGTAFFAKILAGTRGITSILEFGSNLGINLRALHNLLPAAELSAIEINEEAVAELTSWGKTKIYHQSILDFAVDYQRDLTLIKGVLIHINPDRLAGVYARRVEASRRYNVVAEYYNPSPVAISYRGHADKLFKRDFAGEMLDAHANLRLLDYGFAYHRDPTFPQDDLTWFLLEKV
jgi:pseudaminic acid biosynthesis-associated methylase